MELAANPRSIWGGFRSIPRLQQHTEVSSPALLESPARLGRAFGGDTTSWCRSEAAFTCPAQGCPGICKALHWWQVGPSDRIAATSLPGARTRRGDTCAKSPLQQHGDYNSAKGTQGKEQHQNPAGKTASGHRKGSRRNRAGHGDGTHP